jgi:hypothetical protein
MEGTWLARCLPPNHCYRQSSTEDWATHLNALPLVVSAVAPAPREEDAITKLRRSAIVVDFDKKRKYCRQRPRDPLGGLTPVEFEAKLAPATNLAA